MSWWHTGDLVGERESESWRRRDVGSIDDEVDEHCATSGCEHGRNVISTHHDDVTGVVLTHRHTNQRTNISYTYRRVKKVAHTRDYRAYGSGADPGSWQSACR